MQFLIICLVALGASVATSSSICSVNEEYLECKGCDQICNREPVFCTQDCSNPGCYCQSGYVRQNGNENSPCVAVSACAGDQNEYYYEEDYGDDYAYADANAYAGDSYDGDDGGSYQYSDGYADGYYDYQCQVNEEYNDCGGCDQYCNEPPRACSQGCDRPGCYCITGYVRYLGICIPQAKCPSNQAADSAVADYGDYDQCNVNEEFLDCGCDQGCEPRACAQSCPRPGCYCIPGYVRDLGICIPRSTCPGNQASDSDVADYGDYGQCGVNEGYAECGCDKGCEPTACILSCPRPGCYCLPGYVRYLGICIPPSACPSQCGENERLGCGLCDQVCNEEPRSCAAGCERDSCYCREGYVRETNQPGSRCIRESECPALVDYGGSSDQAADSAVAYYSGDYVQCNVNEEYRDCGCDKDCDGPRACAQSCPRPGCYCIPGYVRDLGICIPPSACPRNQNAGPALVDYGGPSNQAADSAVAYYDDYNQCQVNEEFLDCGCDQGCEPRACAQSCPRPGCYCIPGYVRYLGICIPRSACPNQCGENERLGCGLCDQVCNEEPRGCAAGCERYSCYCREGYVRETNQPGSRCIRESECLPPGFSGN